MRWTPLALLPLTLVGIVACGSNDRASDDAGASTAGTATNATTSSSSSGGGDGGANGSGTTAGAGGAGGAPGEPGAGGADQGGGGAAPASTWALAIPSDNAMQAWVTEGFGGTTGFTAEINGSVTIDGTTIPGPLTLAGAVDATGELAWTRPITNCESGSQLAPHPSGDWFMTTKVPMGCPGGLDPAHTVTHQRESVVTRLDSHGNVLWKTWLAPSGNEGYQFVDVWGIARENGRVWVAGDFEGTLAAGGISIGTSPNDMAGFALAFDETTGAPLEGEWLAGSAYASWVLAAPDGALAVIGACGNYQAWTSCLWRRPAGGDWTTLTLPGSGHNAFTGALGADGSVALIGGLNQNGTLPVDGVMKACAGLDCGFVAIVGPDDVVHARVTEIGSPTDTYPDGVTAEPDGTWIVAGSVASSPNGDLGDLALTRLDGQAHVLSSKTWATNPAQLTSVAGGGATVLVGGVYRGGPAPAPWASALAADASNAVLLARVQAP